MLERCAQIVAKGCMAINTKIEGIIVRDDWKA